MSENLEALLKEKIKKVVEAAIYNQILVGHSEIKVAIDEKTGEVEMELLNPFQGCECDDQ